MLSKRVMTLFGKGGWMWIGGLLIEQLRFGRELCLFRGKREECEEWRVKEGVGSTTHAVYNTLPSPSVSESHRNEPKTPNRTLNPIVLCSFSLSKDTLCLYTSVLRRRGRRARGRVV